MTITAVYLGRRTSKLLELVSDPLDQSVKYVQNKNRGTCISFHLLFKVVLRLLGK